MIRLSLARHPTLRRGQRASEEFGPQELEQFLPYVDARQFGPPVRPENPRFGQPTGDVIAGAIYIPKSGFVNDPQLACHNQQRGCEARGGQFLFNAEVVEILTEDGRAAGIKLADGTELLRERSSPTATPAAMPALRSATISWWVPWIRSATPRCGWTPMTTIRAWR